MNEVDTPASSGWIRCENTSLVSQSGCFDASHSEHASACRCREATCLARASGLRAATRPIRAASPRRCVAPSIAHFAQWFRSALIGVPHPLQTCCLLGRFTSRVMSKQEIKSSTVVNSVAVEKLHLPPKQPKFGGYKMPRKLRKSFVGHPSAILFLLISRAGVR